MDLKVIIGAIIILAVFTTGLYFAIKNKKSGDAKEEAKEFLESLSESFKTIMINIIENTSVDDLDNLEEYEAKVLSQIYDTVWEFVVVEAEKAFGNSIIAALALKILDKEFVCSFIEKYIINNDIEKAISDMWAKHFNSKVEDTAIESQEQELIEKFSDTDFNTDNEVTVEDLTPAEDVEIPEEELKNINPQRDEEEEYDDNDVSVEPVTEEEAEVFIDKNGRKRDSKTGRFV